MALLVEAVDGRDMARIRPRRPGRSGVDDGASVVEAGGVCGRQKPAACAADRPDNETIRAKPALVRTLFMMDS